MPAFPAPPRPQQDRDDALKKTRQGLSLAKTTLRVNKELKGKSPELALGHLIIGGMKLAANTDAYPFYTPTASPLRIAAALKKLGVNALTWEPETLMAEIDRKFHDWTPERVAHALERFNQTGVIDSDVPALVRNKIYAIRVIATTDSAHTEWNVFEKVGGALNDRVPNFGLSEPLSAAECARTIAVMENIRPDSYTDEIKIYVAACCHTDGLYTVAPVRWLAQSEPFLDKMIVDDTEAKPETTLKQDIVARYAEIMLHKSSPGVVEDSVVSVQAHKLAAISVYAEGDLNYEGVL